MATSPQDAAAAVGKHTGNQEFQDLLVEKRKSYIKNRDALDRQMQAVIATWVELKHRLKKYDVPQQLSLEEQERLAELTFAIGKLDKAGKYFKILTDKMVLLCEKIKELNSLIKTTVEEEDKAYSDWKEYCESLAGQGAAGAEVLECLRIEGNNFKAHGLLVDSGNGAGTSASGSG